MSETMRHGKYLYSCILNALSTSAVSIETCEQKNSRLVPFKKRISDIMLVLFRDGVA